MIIVDHAPPKIKEKREKIQVCGAVMRYDQTNSYVCPILMQTKKKVSPASKEPLSSAAQSYPKYT